MPLKEGVLMGTKPYGASGNAGIVDPSSTMSQEEPKRMSFLARGSTFFAGAYLVYIVLDYLFSMILGFGSMTQVLLDGLYTVIPVLILWKYRFDGWFAKTIYVANIIIAGHIILLLLPLIPIQFILVLHRIFA
ncbi:hypothetical protein [Oceanidesulfovibrio marinus]|uniref:Uncharacterized protein n=1 Tax=Oceanidesulfovibrio marinus TaxID=370038 RepID=A0ABX6NE74_9BACT|nr:hypothetical protein [Oceanidesulfovibrio marinus]QJT08060.1 hypothetical protein E8L03_03575 [Oceanidesulfovibrio marinus]